jgi:vacuolar-type H+-ATPase subunit F/Vma7
VVVEIPDRKAAKIEREDLLRAFVRRVVGIDILRGD